MRTYYHRVMQDVVAVPPSMRSAGADPVAGGFTMNEAASTSDPLVGRMIRAYKIKEPIGVSRWGKVYRAVQTTMDRTVAVRVLSPGIAALPGKTEHFLEETRADASLMHPHLVTVYEAGQSDGTYFCAMEYMDGPPLARFLRQGDAVDEHRLLQAIAGVARALDFLWQRNVPHQPPLDKNVLTAMDGTVKLINVAPVEMPASPSAAGGRGQSGGDDGHAHQRHRAREQTRERVRGGNARRGRTQTIYVTGRSGQHGGGAGSRIVLAGAGRERRAKRRTARNENDYCASL